jgi:hypothetical protein
LPKPTTVPREHPRAWGSVLWDHRDEVLSLRRARKTWKEIGEQLEKDHGVKLAHRTIRNFFDRYSRRLRKKGFPVGYEPQPSNLPAPDSPKLGQKKPAAPEAQPSTRTPEELAKDFMKQTSEIQHKPLLKPFEDEN